MSEHARYRQRLVRLGADELGATVARVAAERGWSEPGTEARRTYGRFEPARSPWATLLYALGGTSVQVAAYDPHDGEGTLPVDVVDDDAGLLQFTRVEDDGAVASPARSSVRTPMRSSSATGPAADVSCAWATVS